MRQGLHTVCVMPTQVGAHQALRHARRVLFGQIVREQQAAAEGLRRVRIGIE